MQTETLKLDSSNTVGEWVVDRPSRSRTFEQLGIDYCCGGKRPLAEACREKGLDASELIETLARDGDAAAEADTDWAHASLTDLCDHIVATHHAFLNSELPRLQAIVAKVANAHGERHPEVAEIKGVYANLKAELESHMGKEEQVLFPMIRQFERSSRLPNSHCGSVANPIRVMEAEHEGAGDALVALRRLTNGYTTPADACNTWRAMADGLRQIEEDLHVHIHKENNILFPRAIKLEQTLG